MPAGGSLKMEPIDSLSSAMSPPGTPAPPGSTLSAPPSLTPSLAQLEEHQRQMQQDQFQPIHAESSFGFLAELQDALLIVQLCLTDKLPLVRRRLTPFERESIRSGSIFSFIEASAESSSRMVTPPRRSSSSASATSNAMSKDWQPMRRWTDGLAWSKSRVQGNYLVYREVAEKRSITAKRASSAASSHGHPMSAELVEFHQQQEQAQQKRGTRGRPNAQLPVRPVAKSDGLMKRTFSILVDGNVWHVVCETNVSFQKKIVKLIQYIADQLLHRGRC